jgi:SAM-dependent methyltransferase
MPTSLTEMQSVLQCIHCRAGTLVKTSEILACEHCGMTYPIVHGVSLLYPGVIIEPFAGIDPLVVRAICQHQNLPLTPSMLAQVALIFRQVYRFPDQLIDREARVAAILNSVGTIAEPTIAQLRDRQSSPSCFEPECVIYRITHDYLPRTMAAGRRFTGNVCLLNQGAVPIDSRGISPIYLSYHWRSLEGEMVIYDGERTALPIVLMPGRRITLPMLIQVPDVMGDYRLQICLVQEQVAWLDADAAELVIQVVDPADRLTPSDHWSAHRHQDPISLNYYDDHQYAIGLVKQQLGAIGLVAPDLLEIGGNACPMLQCDFPGRLYNLDIDVQGLQLAHLSNQHRNVNMMCICGDVDRIPFGDARLDGIMMFATLHHLLDPVHSLRMLAQKIRPQGFIAILCEPVGHYHCPPQTDPAACIDADFLEALRRGVNEQTFSLDEYAAIFQRSGLVVTKVEVNGTSLKAFLTLPLS